jgi:FAD/FMN-containing dehydrogenase
MGDSELIYHIDPEVDGGDGGPVSDKASILFGPNYPRLQQLKKLYDPEMLFSKWFLIRP